MAERLSIGRTEVEQRAIARDFSHESGTGVNPWNPPPICPVHDRSVSCGTSLFAWRTLPLVANGYDESDQAREDLSDRADTRQVIDRLVERVKEGGVREIIMATNPTLEGDGTALYLSSLLAPTGVRVTRLARGLPSGSVLEFANSQMLADALEGRRTF